MGDCLTGGWVCKAAQGLVEWEFVESECKARLPLFGRHESLRRVGDEHKWFRGLDGVCSIVRDHTTGRDACGWFSGGETRSRRIVFGS